MIINDEKNMLITRKWSWRSYEYPCAREKSTLDLQLLTWSILLQNRERDCRDHMTNVRLLQPVGQRQVSNKGLQRYLKIQCLYFDGFITSCGCGHVH